MVESENGRADRSFHDSRLEEQPTKNIVAHGGLFFFFEGSKNRGSSKGMTLVNR